MIQESQSLQPQPLHPWPNEVSIAINLTEKLQKWVWEETGERLHEVESVLQLDEIYRTAPGLQQVVKDTIDGRHLPNDAYEFLDREESEVIELVLKNLPSEQVSSLKQAIRNRDGEEAANSA